MKNLTLRQLRYVDALARARHFGHAAAACAISQPALSMQIKDLEAGLGLPLFERRAREVRLTPLGETFAARARHILREVDELADLARAAQDGLTGPLRLGVIPTIAPYLLPALIPRLAAAYPRAEANFRETLTERLLDEVEAGRLDAAVVALPVSEPGLEERALFSEEFVLVRPEAEAGRAVPAAEDLARMRLLLLEEGHCFRDQALSFCHGSTGVPRDGLDGSALSTLVQMVGAGIGVTLIPQLAVEVETRSAAVITQRFAPPRPARTVGMIWRRSSPLSAHLEEISQVVRQAAETVLSRAPKSAEET